MNELASKVAALPPETRSLLEARLRDRRSGVSSSAIAPQPESADGFPLSFAQRRLWFVQQMDPGSAVYNVFTHCRLTGPLHVPALEKALGEILCRHEVLRIVCCLSADERPRQKAAPAGPYELAQIDLSGLPKGGREAAACRRALEEARRPFDLRRGGLLRASLLRLGKDEHQLLLNIHHIAADGWSMGIVRQELKALYEAFTAGRPSPLPLLPIQYRDFAVWQRQRLQGRALEGQMAFWKEQLEGVANLRMPSDRPRSTIESNRGAQLPVLLRGELVRGMRELARREGATSFMLFLAAFQALLQRHSGQSRFAVGAPVAGRNREEIEGLIGFFVNMLPLPADLRAEPTFRQLLQRVRKATLGAFAHQDVPFEKMIEELRPKRIPGQSPLFQAAFTLYHQSGQNLCWGEAQVALLALESRTAKFELTLSLEEGETEMAGSFNYSTDLFDQATVAALAGHFQEILRGIVANPDCRVSELPLLQAEERMQILQGWNRTARDYPGALLQQWFEDQAQRTPDATAVAAAGAEPRWSLSYRLLNRRANQFARQLVRSGVGPESVVGVCMQRSGEMVTALLAILKAGAAYLPLDPAYPRRRLEFMLQDSAVTVLVIDRQAPPIGGPGLQRVCLDPLEEAPGPELEGNPPCLARPGNLAYLIYTSGSTGNPKGAMITQAGLVNYLRWASDAYQVASGTGALLHSSLSFDLTVTSLYTPLLSGVTVTLAPAGGGTREMCDALCAGQSFSLLKMTPAQLAPYSLIMPPQMARKRVRHLILGGEALQGEMVSFWASHAPETIVVNEYGPTETVVGCCVYQALADALQPGPVPIGRPIANTRLYLLSERMQPVPIGTPGELCIGGLGLARGYRGRPSLSAQRFVPDPFSNLSGQRLYRSGDLARYRRDGIIECLGRFDHQVKIRSHRIELGEIESLLRAHPQVRDAAVTARLDGGETRLVAYPVAEGPVPAAAEILQYLRDRLPDYMLPSAIVFLESLPLTSNLKVDRQALPSPQQAASAIASAIQAPRDSLELAVASLWMELLDYRPIGVADNFFELGGHSLLAEILAARLEKKFSKTISLPRFFQEPTISHLAGLLREDDGASPFSPLLPIQASGKMPPFFCVHPLSGDALCYYALANHLGPNQPFYGLQAPPLALLGEETLSLEEMAANHILAIRSVQPLGPYLIGGHSFGSIVAFEMAQQIRQAGGEVALLALLDGASPLMFDQIAQHGDAALLAGIARDMARQAGVEIDLTYRELKGLQPDQALQRILSELKSSRLLDEEVGLPWIGRLLKGIRTRGRAIERYRPLPYDGPVTLFRASQAEPESAQAWLEQGVDVTSPSRGWDQLTSQPLKIVYTPGYHATMLAEPDVCTLAELLAERIRKACGLQASRLSQNPDLKFEA